jgi:hypothetical protein
MSNQMAGGYHELHKEDYRQRIDSFHRYLSEFDYDAYYQAQYQSLENT